MPHPNHPAPPTQTLPGGETLTLDNTTIPDPETGHLVPAATLRLPAWRLRELAATLHRYNRIHTIISAEPQPSTETDLAQHLTQAAHALTGGQPH
jgi:hypothetical protein